MALLSPRRCKAGRLQRPRASSGSIAIPRATVGARGRPSSRPCTGWMGRIMSSKIRQSGLTLLAEALDSLPARLGPAPPCQAGPAPGATAAARGDPAVHAAEQRRAATQLAGRWSRASSRRCSSWCSCQPRAGAALSWRPARASRPRPSSVVVKTLRALRDHGHRRDLGEGGVRPLPVRAGLLLGRRVQHAGARAAHRLSRRRCARARSTPRPDASRAGGLCDLRRSMPRSSCSSCARRGSQSRRQPASLGRSGARHERASPHRRRAPTAAAPTRRCCASAASARCSAA